MNVRNPVNPKRVAASNIPNANPTSKALSVFDSASRYLDNGQSERAFKLLGGIKPAALPISLQAEYYDRLASAHQMGGRFPKAVAAAARAASLYKEIGDPTGLLDMNLVLGDLYRQLEKFQLAARFYKKAFPLIKATRRSHHQIDRSVDALTGMALCERGRGRFLEAIQLLKKSLLLYQRNNDKAGLAYIHWAIGTTSRFAGRFKDAIRHLKTSIALYRKLQDKSGLAYARAGLGGSYRMIGRAAKSGALYRKAYAVFSKQKDEFGMAYSLCGQSNAARMRNDYSQALILMTRAENLYRKLEQKGPLAFVLWSRAQTEIALQKFSPARKHLAEARALFTKVNDKRGLVYALLGEGELQKKRNFRRAKKIFQQTAAKATALRLPFEKLHALRRLGKKSFLPYERLGVDVSKFRLYSTLP